MWDCHLKKINKEKRTGGTYLSSYQKYVGKELFALMKLCADKEIFYRFVFHALMYHSIRLNAYIIHQKNTNLIL